MKYSAYITLNPVWPSQRGIIDPILRMWGFDLFDTELSKGSSYARGYKKEGDNPNKLSTDTIKLLNVIKDKKFNIWEWEIKPI